MAALGCSTATTQIGRPCAARNNIRVAGFQAITQQSVNDRSQSSSVAMMGLRGEANQYNSAWGRGNNTVISGRMPSFGSQSGGWWGNFLQIFRPSTNAFNNFGSPAREPEVDNPVREPEVLEPEAEPGKQALNVVESGQNVNVGKAVDTGSTVATSALDKVGDALRTTGLEINLDVGLKELSIKELVLKDLGLVLEVKTKPQAQAQAEAAQAEKDKGGNNTAA